MKVKWPRIVDCLLRAYPKHVGPLPDGLRAVLESARHSPPKLPTKHAYFALKYAGKAAILIDELDAEDSRTAETAGFANHRRERAVADMARRVAAFLAELEAPRQFRWEDPPGGEQKG